MTTAAETAFKLGLFEHILDGEALNNTHYYNIVNVTKHNVFLINIFRSRKSSSYIRIVFFFLEYTFIVCTIGGDG